MTPIHGETDILRRLRNVEAKSQIAKWPKAKSQMAKVEQLMHDEVRTQMAKPL